MRCVVAGAGFVGLSTSIVLVEKGHSVHLVDVDEARAQRIAAGEVPFLEPGVESALRGALATGRLAVGTDLVAACVEAEAVFLCVGTPSRPNGDADLSFVKAASRSIGQGLRKSNLVPFVAVKSTVPPGTTRDLVKAELETASRKTEGQGFHLVMNPEFLREGRALEDARGPDRIVVGAFRAEAAETFAALWSMPNVPLVRTDPTTAELIKYASNALLGLKIGFANELANLSSALGVDVYDVVRGVGFDKRIGPEFMRAGAGFGGSCLPKDLRALVRTGKRAGRPLPIAKALLEANEAQPLEVVAILEKALGGLSGKSVALLGLAFKPDTDDVRETRALPIYQALVERGAKVVCWDPVAIEPFKRLVGGSVESTDNLATALRDKDAAVLQTEWKQLRELPAEKWAMLLRGKTVVDGRRSVDAASFESAGLRYFAIGWPKGP